LPRIIIAIFIGIIISTPLEMKIFEDRINSQIVKDNAIRTSETKQIADADYKRLQTLIERQTKLFDERHGLEEKLQAAEEDLRNEVEGKAISGKVGKGQIYEQKKDYRNSCQKALDSWNANNKDRLQRIENEIANCSTKVESFESDIKNGLEENGFCVRYVAFSNVKRETPTARIVSLFIMFLFIIIEVAPTFFKMMVASGPYDCLLDAERHSKKVSSMKIISDINDRINTEIQISSQKNQERIAQEIKNNQELLKQLSYVQSEILSKAISLWREEEMKKVMDNPSTYIKTNQPSK
jgi:hypothetical protein